MGLTFERVAVIGAGVSGLAAARHLLDYGLDVTIYERSSKPGGVWSVNYSISSPFGKLAYDERKPLESKYPSILPSVAGIYPDSDSDSQGVTSQLLPLQTENLILKHAPPGPAYFGLTTNISTKLQEMKGHPWKEGTGDFVNVKVVGDYLKDYARRFHLEQVLRYNTKIEAIEKVDSKWVVKSKLLNKTHDGNIKFVEKEETFDKVVVASGHYHASRVPDIKGLKDWRERYPERVMHSKVYRRPQELAGQTVLLIGGGVSSTDIAREINGMAKKVYQSTRGGQFDLPLSFLPPRTERVGEFLVTDGTQVHNLHKDIFYIPDPTLAFVGTAYYVSTFSLFEFQAIAVAAVFSGRAKLPREEEMREEYRLKVKEKGFGRAFHALNGREPEYVRELVDWINTDAAASGGQKVEGHSEAWLREDEIKKEKLLERFEKQKQEELQKQEQSYRIYNLRSQGPLPTSEYRLFDGNGSKGKLEEQASGENDWIT
ncbi:hypothetical protein SS1G_03023 [Sclerotinia sclerotiorum 1980 UF-70]|uniref:FAD dependent oxidoreductase domain-containing protein n=1 Tax=Sclerotinia sclerotiorum (strain ATCC 18683 / 1980 / Ss-1) TaxID=665079 RepID=A7ECI4_SCLS1|nr:hypothetical protein SS1G_03023 [Sclerotinia sclerotiorum 1980 UF-70]EDO00163.1 hypothetical protein SS1G_03023 [Sclerotinia sclerotiorum 1980 UF-70]